MSKPAAPRRMDLHERAVQGGTKRVIDVLEWFVPETRNAIVRNVVGHYAREDRADADAGAVGAAAADAGDEG